MMELAAFASLLERAGLLEVARDEEGRDGYRLTADGRGVNRMLAMVSGPDADEVLEALLSRGRQASVAVVGREPTMNAAEARDCRPGLRSSDVRSD